jgi:hypothetical protein
MNKRLKVLGFFVLIVGIFIFIKTSVSFASTLYFNDLTNNISGWNYFFAPSDTPTFSSDGMSHFDSEYSTGTSYSSLACVTVDITLQNNPNNPSAANSIVGMSNLNGSPHTFGDTIAIHIWWR